MDPLQALNYIDQALASVTADRGTHQKLQRAMSTLTDIVTDYLTAKMETEPGELAKDAAPSQE